MRPVSLFLLVVFVSASLSFGQESEPVELTLHWNNGSTPLLGVDYQLTNRAFVRGSAGYFRSGGTDVVISRSGTVESIPYTLQTVSGSLSMLFRLYDVRLISLYTGPEVQYLYGWASRDVGLFGGNRNDRLTISEVVGLNLHITDWLDLFGEVGFGYLRGMETNSNASFEGMRITRWGFTHAGPGLKVQL